MSSGGPKTTPTILKELHGNPGKRPLPVDEPEGVGDLWAPPQWFDDEHRAEWVYAVDHAPPGLLTGTDRAVLAVWCVADIERASSGAVLVAMGADRRRIAPGARIMVHETRADLKDAPAEVLRSTLADLELFDGIAADIIASATGQPVERVSDWRRSTTTFSAHEAVAAGLAHEIA